MAAGHLNPDQTPSDFPRIDAHPDGAAHERDRHHGKKEEKDQLQRPESRSEYQIHRRAVAHDRPLPDRSEAEHVPADLADTPCHVGPVNVAHDDRRDEQHRRIRWVQPREAIQHAFRVLVAELIPGDQRHEQKPEQDRDDEDPEQRVAVVGAGRAHVHDVPGPEPGEDDDNAWPERPEVFDQ